MDGAKNWVGGKTKRMNISKSPKRRNGGVSFGVLGDKTKRDYKMKEFLNY